METIFQQTHNTHTSKKLVSVVIPVLNELENVKILNAFLKIAFASKRLDYEAIYIDDHSTDGTFEYLQRVSDEKRISVFRKQGKKGKAFSLVEGFAHAKGEFLSMIDADLQYPVTALPEMVRLLDSDDVIVANRKIVKTSVIRKILSLGFRTIFGNFLFGLHTDVQSGLKVFKRRVFELVAFQPRSPWTFDLEFLFRVREAGFSIRNYDITFSARQNGTSKVLFIQQAIEIGLNALCVRVKKINPLHIPPIDEHSMTGAGIGYKRKLYVTHTTLAYQKTAFRTFILPQLIAVIIILAMSVFGMLTNPLITAQIAVSVISVIYFIDVVFNLYVIYRSLASPKEIKFNGRELLELDSVRLPVYTILCPLYKEGVVLPQFLKAISELDWPKDKLDVLLLLEEDDFETIDAVGKINLSPYVRTIVVPYSEPKTKPKACNYGLNKAKGEYIVIYDAEDIPESDQLKKAYLGFLGADPQTVCLQAKLNYYNPKQNLLTRFFTSEYSLWFDLTLPGFQSLNTSLPLGGTSNHFKTTLLRKLQGWDAFNVTEDADLGIRLFKEGYKTAIIDSTTYEEANSNVHNWLRQRSRWIKGYIQSYLVHTRDIFAFTRRNAVHALLMQLIIGSKLTFIFLNPLLWLTTISYFGLYRFVGQNIEAIYATPAFYLAVISLVFGNFLFFYYYMIGNAKRNYWDLMASSLFIPIYWVLISFAGWIALYQLIFKPHYWEKTVHGLHLTKANNTPDTWLDLEKPTRITRIVPSFVYEATLAIRDNKKKIAAGVMLVFGTVVAHIANLLFNVFLYRDNTIPFHAISVISLFSSFFYLISIPVNALETVSTHKTAVLESKYGFDAASAFRKRLRKILFFISIITTIIWIGVSPSMRVFFKVDSIYPFMIFASVFMVAFEYALERGYMTGKLLFGRLAVLIICEPILKLAAAFVLISTNHGELAYATIPYSIIVAYLIGTFLFPKQSMQNTQKPQSDSIRFPLKFFAASMVTGISGIAFLSLDVLLANHFLSPDDAGKYALVALVGKMIYFLGSLSSQFVLPLVSKYQDKKKQSGRVLSLSLFATTLLSLIGLTVFGYFGNITLPILLGEKANIVLPYILTLSVGVACFTVSRVFVSYYLARNIYTFPVSISILTLIQVLLIYYRHDSLSVFVQMMSAVGVAHLLLMAALHFNNKAVIATERSLTRFYSFITRKQLDHNTVNRKVAILIFNWRDIKHVWAGGAEVYIHEIAKRWVQQGSHVTIFCGSDNRTPLNEVIDGVEVIRRGGRYTVYFWAAVYYVFVLHKKFDVVIDCENGIPFFTPLYVRKPVFLLIHHVHQKVFSQYLPLPLSIFASLLELKLMPWVFKNRPIITVSESSRREIIKLGFSNPENIHIVYNGIDASKFRLERKTSYPSFIYLGRLKPHKNIDICIKAFAKVRECHPQAKLNIVGDGESEMFLKELVKTLSLEDSVRFYGRVSDLEKAKLLARSWVMVQPSQVEGWGITVIEANASGTPVIASNVNGLKDSVVGNETGILVEARNVKQLTHAMDAIVTNKALLERYTKNALTWSRNFTWDKSAETILGLISDHLRKETVRPIYRKAAVVVTR